MWLFLDLPEDGFERSVEFWRQVTRTRLSPWRGERSEFATLLPAEGDPWVKVQRVGGKGGVHLDLDVDVPLSEAAERAVALGAEVVATLDDVVVCRSPGELSFCLCRGGREGGPTRQAWEGEPSLLDQACLDIPRARYAAEVAFWSHLTGWPVVVGEPDEFVRLAWASDMPVKLLLQQLEEQDGPVRAHADVAALDPATEVARHVSLGAEEEGPGRGWTVLRDPARRRYCVTDRDPRAGRVIPLPPG